MTPDSVLTAIVTVVTSSGFVATLTTLAGVISKARQGQRIRETARREQLAAVAAPTKRELAAEEDADAERSLRRRWQDVAHEMRRVCIDHGTPLSALPTFPDDH